MKVVLDPQRGHPHHQEPAAGAGPRRVPGRRHHRAGRGRGPGRLPGADVDPRSGPVLRGRLPVAGRSLPGGPRRSGGTGRLGRGRRSRRPVARSGNRVPLLARAVLAPLTVQVRSGALHGLADVLADSRISAGGDVAVVVGPGLGREIAELVRPGSPGRTCCRSPAARSMSRPSWARSCAPAVTTPSSASAAAAPSTPSSTPPPSTGCRWSRSPPAWPTTASPPRSACSTVTAPRSPTGCTHRSRCWWTSTTWPAAPPVRPGPASATR